MVEEYAQLSQALEPDGSLRDIYVAGTDLDDWRKFLRWITQSYPSEYQVDLQPREMPDDTAAIFEEAARASVVLMIFLGPAQINCHFFAPDELELDLDPSQLQEPDGVHLLADFLKRLANLLGREVFLTEESSPDRVHYSYTPDGPT